MTKYRTYSDAELIELLRKKDREAFTEIYDRYMGVLYVHSLKMVKDEHEAEDLVHELFVSLWLNAAEMTINVTLSAYLYRAIKNRIFNLFAHQKVKVTHLESLQAYINAGDWQTDDQLRAKELALLIEKEVSQMPVKMREVFELSRNAGLSYKEIAERLDISDKTVKKQINNALKILRLKINLFFMFIF